MPRAAFHATVTASRMQGAEVPSNPHQRVGQFTIRPTRLGEGFFGNVLTSVHEETGEKVR